MSVETIENKTQHWNMCMTKDVVFRLGEAASGEFVEILDRPARSIPELAGLLSSDSVFDD